MKAINVLLLVILGLLAQGRADETEDLMAGELDLTASVQAYGI